ncbi:MAG: helix-turn-helix domain-containing protein [Acidobacteriota bacterium]
MSGKSSMKRWSAKRKQEVMLRLLRGESLNALSRGTGLPAGVLSSWRDEFLEGGLAMLKRRADDPKVAALERGLWQAKRLVGNLLMDKELLEMRIARFECEAPFPKRRSTP